MQLIELIETTVKGLGYELVEFETSPRARLLRVFIDKPEAEPTQKSGIGVDDCAAVSNQLSAFSRSRTSISIASKCPRRDSIAPW
jgi:ribosome maturation factor RimP